MLPTETSLQLFLLAPQDFTFCLATILYVHYDEKRRRPKVSASCSVIKINCFFTSDLAYTLSHYTFLVLLENGLRLIVKAFRLPIISILTYVQ